MLHRRRKAVQQEAAKVSTAGAGAVARAADARLDCVARLLDAFNDWMSEWSSESSRWIAFDRFIRTGLHDAVGAEGVRCFRVTVAGSALESLVPARGKLHALIPADQGVFGTVLETGHALVRSTDAESINEAVWCFPILDGAVRRGVVSVARMTATASDHAPLLDMLAGVISLLWNRLCDREQLAVARETDDRTGVLTRANFFRVAETALSDGYTEHEPAVVMAVALEGVRGLDDRGLWEQRDALVSSVGTAIRARLRSDDVVGRFSDDRFVALMRRMDLPLASMIADKLMTAIRAMLADDATHGGGPIARCCITGPAWGDHSLRELISTALTGISRGRKQGEDTVVADLRDASHAPPRATAVVGGDGA